MVAESLTTLHYSIHGVLETLAESNNKIALHGSCSSVRKSSRSFSGTSEISLIRRSRPLSVPIGTAAGLCL